MEDIIHTEGGSDSGVFFFYGFCTGAENKKPK